MFSGGLDVQIEQYFISKVTDMQITVTTRDLCCCSASLFLCPLSCTALKFVDNGQFSTVHEKHTIQNRIEECGCVTVALFSSVLPSWRPFLALEPRCFMRPNSGMVPSGRSFKGELVLSCNIRRSLWGCRKDAITDTVTRCVRIWIGLTCFSSTWKPGS